MFGQVKMVIGSEALEVAVTESRTLELILKLGGSIASLTAIEGGSPAEVGGVGDIVLLVVGDKSLEGVRVADRTIHQTSKCLLRGGGSCTGVYVFVCVRERKKSRHRGYHDALNTVAVLGASRGRPPQIHFT
jgi:hypothetical protein